MVRRLSTGDWVTISLYALALLLHASIARLPECRPALGLYLLLIAVFSIGLVFAERATPLVTASMASVLVALVLMGSPG